MLPCSLSIQTQTNFLRSCRLGCSRTNDLWMIHGFELITVSSKVGEPSLVKELFGGIKWYSLSF